MSHLDFLSPISNHRDDKYGGSLENRLRLPLEIVELTRSKWDKPLFFRVSASDYFEGEERFDDGVGKDEEWRFWCVFFVRVFATTSITGRED